MMIRLSADLIAEYLPGVPLENGLDTHQSLMLNQKAMAILGYVAQHDDLCPDGKRMI